MFRILHRVKFADKRLDGFPLIVAEIIDDAQEHFFSLIQQREYGMLHHILRHDRTSGCLITGRPEPFLVVLGNPFGERCIGLGALIIDKRTHG